MTYCYKYKMLWEQNTKASHRKLTSEESTGIHQIKRGMLGRGMLQREVTTYTKSRQNMGQYNKFKDLPVPLCDQSSECQGQETRTMKLERYAKDRLEGFWNQWDCKNSGKLLKGFWKKRVFCICLINNSKFTFELSPPSSVTQEAAVYHVPQQRTPVVTPERSHR